MQRSLDVLDIDVERNAYGRQIDSRIAHVSRLKEGEMEAVFIRAPIIRRVGADARVLGTYLGIQCGSLKITIWPPRFTQNYLIRLPSIDALLTVFNVLAFLRKHTQRII